MMRSPVEEFGCLYLFDGSVHNFKLDIIISAGEIDTRPRLFYQVSPPNQ